MSINRTVALGLLLATAFLSVPSVGLADENDSRTFFAQGRKLRAANNCNDAITAFQRALDLWPQGLGALRNIAECEEQLGHYASARNSYWSLRRAVLQSNDPHYQGWDKEAEAAYDRLATKVAKITVKVEGAAPETVQITIDGKPLDPRLAGVALERDLGNHDLELRYGGATPLSEKRTLAAGSNEVVTFNVPAKGANATATASASPSADPSGTAASEVSHFPYRPLMITGFAIGAVGIIGAGIGAGLYYDTRSSMTAKDCAVDANDSGKLHCYNGTQSKLEAQAQKGATAATLVNVFTVAAVVGAGAGIALWIASPSSSEHPSTTGPKSGAGSGTKRAPMKAEIGFSPSLNGGVVFARGSF